MSTFAVFGMTRDVALAMANKEVKSVRKTPLGDEHVPMSEQQFGHQPGRAAA
ncbi:hypothetical protein N0564_30905 [Pseudomonas aeruginosa]|nr:hypothetical protein [Pseudomonas aeruginosa]MCS8629335.1 hypothetical protein [Pseudomonas aeruginosa]MCS8629755.1 hypothetical protein [Pseudomonas aeruginosa]